MNYFLTLTTTDREAIAKKLAEEAVSRRLAACVQIVGPLTSVYRWDGKIEVATEYRCEMKTNSVRLPALRNVIAELHSYDLPEIISIPLTDLSPEYAAWLEEELREPN